MNTITPKDPSIIVNIPKLVVITEKPYIMAIKDNAKMEMLLILNPSPCASNHSFSSLDMAKMAIIPIGMVIRKILRHLKYCVRKPPRTGPVESPTYLLLR